MLSTLNWNPLQVRRLRYRLVFFYKMIHKVVAVLTSKAGSTFISTFRPQKIAANTLSPMLPPPTHTITQWNKLSWQYILANTVEGHKALVTEPALSLSSIRNLHQIVIKCK